MSTWTQLFTQDSASNPITMIISFHDLLLLTMTLVITIITYIIIFLITNNYTNNNLNDAHNIELIWTISPSLILILLAAPSLHLLYITEETNDPNITIKAIAHQWYWTYEYKTPTHFSYDSYMLADNNLNPGEFRLLEVDNRIIVPIQTNIRLLVTSSDVIHAWTIPSLGINTDAIPGRLNQLTFVVERPGIFYGQCSEICGINHSFIPIVIESINISSFISWSNSYSVINN